MTTVRKSIKSEKLKFSKFYGFWNLLCVMEITVTINTMKNERDDVIMDPETLRFHISLCISIRFWKVLKGFSKPSK